MAITGEIHAVELVHSTMTTARPAEGSDFFSEDQIMVTGLQDLGNNQEKSLTRGGPNPCQEITHGKRIFFCLFNRVWRSFPVFPSTHIGVYVCISVYIMCGCMSASIRVMMRARASVSE